jgi:molybdopterin-containing oxidoreductase family membrane subunit
MTTSTVAEKKPSISPGFIAWLGFVGILLLIGLVSAVMVFWKGLVITNMSDTIPWGLWITIDLSAIALGAGAFTLSAIVYIFKIERFRPILRLAVLVGFIGYTSALLTLVMDIGRPDRFYHPWIYWNVHSVLWEITWCITIYLSILILEFLPVIAEASFFDRWPWVRKAAAILHKTAAPLAIIGLGISLLHQSSLGAAYGIVRSRAVWFKPSMPIMFIVSAIAVGPALTVAIAYVLEWVTGKMTVPHNVLRTIVRFSGVALLVYGYIKMWDFLASTYYGNTEAVTDSLALLNQLTPYNFTFWVFEVLLGILVPAVLFLTPRFNRNPANVVLGSFLAVLGIIVNRWNVTVSGLFVPLEYSPGILYNPAPVNYFPNLVEWGVAIGILGYMLLLLTLGVKYLPLFKEEHGHT